MNYTSAGKVLPGIETVSQNVNFISSMQSSIVFYSLYIYSLIMGTISSTLFKISTILEQGWTIRKVFFKYNILFMKH